MHDLDYNASFFSTSFELRLGLLLFKPFGLSAAKRQIGLLRRSFNELNRWLVKHNKHFVYSDVVRLEDEDEEIFRFSDVFHFILLIYLSFLLFIKFIKLLGSSIFFDKIRKQLMRHKLFSSLSPSHSGFYCLSFIRKHL